MKILIACIISALLFKMINYPSMLKCGVKYQFCLKSVLRIGLLSCNSHYEKLKNRKRKLVTPAFVGNVNFFYLFYGARVIFFNLTSLFKMINDLSMFKRGINYQFCQKFVFGLASYEKVKTAKCYNTKHTIWFWAGIKQT